MSRAINTLILFICIHCSVFSQLDTSFIKHLRQNGLKTEYWQYLEKCKCAADTLAKARADYFLKYFNDSLFLENYKVCQPLCLDDRFFMHEASIKMLLGTNTAKNFWFTQPELNRIEPEICKIYAAAEAPLKTNADSLAPELKETFQKLQKIYQKQPFFAGVLSGVLPGAGKFYAGKKRSGAVHFFICALYAAQWAESSSKLGYNHAFSWVNAGFFTAFYLANIYGSYLAIIDLRKEYKKQFISDAIFYYR